jgi:hypothetical protein
LSTPLPPSLSAANGALVVVGTASPELPPTPAPLEGRCGGAAAHPFAGVRVHPRVSAPSSNGCAVVPLFPVPAALPRLPAARVHLPARRRCGKGNQVGPYVLFFPLLVGLGLGLHPIRESFLSFFSPRLSLQRHQPPPEDGAGDRASDGITARPYCPSPTHTCGRSLARHRRIASRWCPLLSSPIGERTVA